MKYISTPFRNKLVHFKRWSNKKYGIFNSLKKQVKICALIVSYSIVSLNDEAHAQVDTSTTTKTYDLEEVDIFSSSPDQQLEQNGKSFITVISRDELQSSPSTSLEEIIKYAPCIEAQSRNLFGVQSDFSIRGSIFNQVLVTIDGVPVNDPLTGHYSGNIPVPLAEVERIEVIRGPWASKYGPSAMGGVINIVTKTFSPNPVPDVSTSGSFLAGENKLFSTNGGLFVKENKLSLSGGVMYNESDGEQLPSGVSNFFKIRKTSLSAAYQLNPNWKLAFRTAYEKNDFSAQNFYTYSPADTAEEKMTRFWNHLLIRHVGENSSTTFSAGYAQNTDTFTFYPGQVPNAHKTRFMQSSLVHSFNLNKNVKLTFGGQADYRTIASTDRGNHADWHAGLYSNSLIKPVNNLVLLAGIRGDYDKNFGFEILPQLSFEYSLNSLLFRGSSGRSIRAADYTERYTSYNLPLVTTGRNLGNPSLKAESSWGHEVGLDFHPVQNITISTTAFMRNSKNLIDYVLTPETEISGRNNLDSGAVYMYAKNISNLTSSGFEMEFHIMKNINQTSYFEFTGGYVFVHTSNSDSIISKYISSHAKHLATANLRYKNKYFMMALNSMFKERGTDFYQAIGVEHEKYIQVWNARMDINIYRNMLYANVQVKNIFDKTYYEVLGAKMPGRWFLGGIVWDF